MSFQDWNLDIAFHFVVRPFVKSENYPGKYILTKAIDSNNILSVFNYLTTSATKTKA